MNPVGFLSYKCMQKLTETEESCRLGLGQNLALYSVTSDGVYVYSCAPWGEAQIQWKLVYDEDGRPATIQLIDKNIRE